LQSSYRQFVVGCGAALLDTLSRSSTIELRGLAIASESTDYLAEKGESPMPLPPKAASKTILLVESEPLLLKLVRSGYPDPTGH
jgi:hypothetical protein